MKKKSSRKANGVITSHIWSREITQKNVSAALSCCSAICWLISLRNTGRVCTCVSTPRCELKTEDNLWDPAPFSLPLGPNLGHRLDDRFPTYPDPFHWPQRMLFLYSITFYIIWKVFYLSSSYHLICFPNSTDWRKEVDLKMFGI